MVIIGKEALNHIFGLIKSAIGQKANIPTTVKMTIPAVSWSGDAAPYTASLAVEGVLADEKQLLLITPQAVAANDQVTAWFEAAVLGGTHTAGHITLKAYGKKPEIDIPVNIVIGGVTK